jgi:hypothetical protein
LGGLERRLRPYYLFVLFNPFLTAMILLVDSSPGDDLAQLTLSVLLTVSLTGILFTVGLAQRTAQFIFGFTGRHSTSRPR